MAASTKSHQDISYYCLINFTSYILVHIFHIPIAAYMLYILSHHHINPLLFYSYLTITKILLHTIFSGPTFWRYPTFIIYWFLCLHKCIIIYFHVIHKYCHIHEDRGGEVRVSKSGFQIQYYIKKISYYIPVIFSCP